jgi:hypothetical protein
MWPLAAHGQQGKQMRRVAVLMDTKTMSWPVLRDMQNSRHRAAIASPSSSRATKRRRSSTGEVSFHGIGTSRRKGRKV